MRSLPISNAQASFISIERGFASPRSSMLERGFVGATFIDARKWPVYLLPVVVVVVVGRRRLRRQPYIDEKSLYPRVTVLSAGPLK